MFKNISKFTIVTGALYAYFSGIFPAIYILMTKVGHYLPPDALKITMQFTLGIFGVIVFCVFLISALVILLSDNDML